MRCALILLLSLAGPLLAQGTARLIELKPVMYQMMFSPRVLTVRAGESVELVFDNIDVQPHNVLICTPGSKERVGKLADRLAVSSGSAHPDYIPRCPEVLHAMKPVKPGKKGRLRFVAPAKPGDYVFICTCPGQWRRMNGIFKVIPAE
jgi:uncharacterized cupredoxin-like copper-binding protein